MLLFLLLFSLSSLFCTIQPVTAKGWGQRHLSRSLHSRTTANSSIGDKDYDAPRSSCDYSSSDHDSDEYSFVTTTNTDSESQENKDDDLWESWSADDFLQFMDDDHDDEQNLLFYSPEEEEEEEQEQVSHSNSDGVDMQDQEGSNVSEQKNSAKTRLEKRQQSNHNDAVHQSPVTKLPGPPPPLQMSQLALPNEQKQSSAIPKIDSEAFERPTNQTAAKSETEEPNLVISGMTPWVRRYLATRPCLLVIPRDFWLDNFNLAQLPPVLEFWIKLSPQARGIEFPSGWLYKQALARILARDTNATAESAASAGVVDDIVEWATTLLYQLVHQRYVVSPRGLEATRRRFLFWQYQYIKKNPRQPPPFGRCPRASCQGFALVPSGPDNPVDEKNAKSDIRNWRYCGLCRETWHSSSHLAESAEGCAWGSTLGPLFHLTFPSFLQGTRLSRPTTAGEPRIFGFRLHPGAVA